MLIFIGKNIKNIVKNIEKSPTNFYLWSLSFFSIIIIRLLTEVFLFKLTIKKDSYFFLYEFTHTFLFFLISYLLFLFLLTSILKTNIKKSSNLLLFGFVSIIIPPIVDFIFSGGKGFWSFYKFDSIFGLIKRFFTFFGDNPQMGITYGVRFEILLMLFLLFLLSYIKTKRRFFSFFIVFISYLVFFILGTFPSYITFLLKGFQKNIFQISDLAIAQLFLTPITLFAQKTHSIESALNIKMSLIYTIFLSGIILIGFFLNYRKKFLIFLSNIRPAQIVYHLGLFAIGVKLGETFTKTTISWNFFNIIALLNISLAITLSWITSVIINDIFDEKIDRISNTERPLVSGGFTKNDYLAIGMSTFFFSILFSIIVSPKISLLLIAYQALASIYSIPPLRFKKIVFLSAIISSFASVLIFISGFILISPNQDIVQLPYQIIWLLFISLSLSLPIKDLKDISGDKKYYVKTIPVVFGEYWGKIIIGFGVFISYILSVILLNEYRLFWWAVIFGSFSFWTINCPGKIKLITNKNLIWWLLIILFFYLIVIYFKFI